MAGLNSFQSNEIDLIDVKYIIGTSGHIVIEESSAGIKDSEEIN